MSTPSTEPVEHWSLRKEQDRYSLLVQIRPTDAFDGVVRFDKMERAAEMMQRLVGFHDRRLAAPLMVSEVWFESSWETTEDGIYITKTQTVDKLGDDVMLLVVAELQPAR